MRQRYFTEIRQLFKLALPLFLTQMVAALMFFTDTVVASKAGYLETAAVSVATGIWYPIVFTSQGLLIAITPVIANLFGANRDGSLTKVMVGSVYQSLYIAMALMVVVFGVYQLLEIPINALNMEPDLANKSLSYLGFVIWGFPPLALFFVLRGFCEGVGMTKPALIVSLIGLVANIPLNYIFVFGLFGMPELGGAGCGLATALVQWLSLIALVVYFFVSSKLKHYDVFKQVQKPNWAEITQLTKIGAPIAFSMFFETTLFACMALFIAPLGALEVAGHQVAYSYSAVVFMAPLAIAMAATIRVGYLRGYGDYQLLSTSIKTCFTLAIAFGTLVMLTTYMFKLQIIALYTHDAAVVALASSILTITAIYQLPDAIQVMAAGIFKGLKITKPLFFITFIAYWPIGFALGFVLARTDYIVPKLGATGFWMGVVIGLTTASTLFVITLIRTMKGLKTEMQSSAVAQVN